MEREPELPCKPPRDGPALPDPDVLARVAVLLADCPNVRAASLMTMPSPVPLAPDERPLLAVLVDDPPTEPGDTAVRQLLRELAGPARDLGFRGAMAVAAAGVRSFDGMAGQLYTRE